MSIESESVFVEQMRRASKRRAETPVAVDASADPTFPYRRSLANIAEATMVRVVELETEAGRLADQSKALTEIAKKLRAAVVANT